MHERTLGTGGPALSVVGLGCNNFGMKLDGDTSIAVVHAALDAGITHFDTAEMYGGGASETHLGTALGTRRSEVVIATKFSPRPADEPYEPGALASRITTACESSLRRLGTDYIDLYYQHYPDPDAPLAEGFQALEALRTAGKVRAFASSNVSAEQIVAGGTEFVGTQIEWNLLQRAVEAEVVPAARQIGLGVIPYFPLASGLLTGKYRLGEQFPAGSRLAAMPYFAAIATTENLERVERLKAFAEDRGHTLLELAVAWLLAQDGVASVICGATTPGQVTANALAAGWVLTASDLRDVEQQLSPLGDGAR
ncbi:MAG TPA: aldo/keto reductase [Frankiaceae bacterium]|nr:aldo/keto reductase [Frankiaceae bacterium]